MIKHDTNVTPHDSHILSFCNSLYRLATKKLRITDHLSMESTGHYNDVMMSATASQITSLTIVYSSWNIEVFYRFSLTSEVMMLIFTKCLDDEINVSSITYINYSVVNKLKDETKWPPSTQMHSLCFTSLYCVRFKVIFFTGNQYFSLPCQNTFSLIWKLYKGLQCTINTMPLKFLRIVLKHEFESIQMLRGNEVVCELK